MENIDNKIENQTIEETLNNVKNGIMNGDITKEQAEMLIKKCDVLIKKNKKNLDRMEKMSETNRDSSLDSLKELDSEKHNIQKAEHYWEEEILDRMVMEDDRIGDDVRTTISDWFACNLIESDDNVYIQKGNDFPECIYFFDEDEDLLRGMAVRYDDLTQVIKELDENYKRVGDRQMWHDRRLEMDVTVYGNWLIHEFEHGYCKYAEVIKRFEC